MLFLFKCLSNQVGNSLDALRFLSDKVIFGKEVVEAFKFMDKSAAKANKSQQVCVLRGFSAVFAKG
ncbi:MAG TPA: hypothetical protein VK658_02990 [Chryseolinea sp.]|nr:hypothetical protein [Chryseolinea sp.]